MAINPFEGFDFIRSGDIQIAEDQQFQNAFLSGNQHQMRAAAIGQATNTLAGGSLPMKRARKIEQTLKAAQQAVTEGPDDIENQISFIREAQKLAIQNDLPEIAMQATSRLSALTTAQEERARLKAGEGRAAAQDRRAGVAADQATEAHEMEMGALRMANVLADNAVVIDNSTSPPTIIESFSMTKDPKKLGEMQRFAQENGYQLTTGQHFIDLTEAEKDRVARLSKQAAGVGIAGRSGLYAKYHEQATGTNSFAITSSDFIDLLLRQDADTLFSAGGNVQGLLKSAAHHARNFFGDEHQSLLEEDFRGRSQNSEFLKRHNLTWDQLSGEKKALIMELGYALATAREGGRLTDQDVERAIISLGLEQPNPRAVAWIFGRALKRRRDLFQHAPANFGLSDLPDVQENTSRILGALDEQLVRLSSAYDIDFIRDKTLKELDAEWAEINRLAPRTTKVEEVDTGTKKPKVVVVPTGGALSRDDNP